MICSWQLIYQTHKERMNFFPLTFYINYDLLSIISFMSAPYIIVLIKMPKYINRNLLLILHKCYGTNLSKLQCVARAQHKTAHNLFLGHTKIWPAGRGLVINISMKTETCLVRSCQIIRLKDENHRKSRPFRQLNQWYLVFYNLIPRIACMVV